MSRRPGPRAGLFRYRNRLGPRGFTALRGYPQPSLVAFDPHDSDVLVAGGVDSGVFLSVDGGTSWQRVTDPLTPGLSGRPHVPRPIRAYFDHEPDGRVSVYLGSKGRGVWRLSFDDPAGGGVAPQVRVVPVGWRFDYTDGDHHLDRHLVNVAAERVDDTRTPPLLTWETVVRFDDTNDDDDYAWQVNHQLLRLTESHLAEGNSPLIASPGGRASRPDSHTAPELVGWSDATVVLTGWGLDYDDGDHHVQEIGVRLVNVTYDRAAGTVSWTAEASLTDDNGDDAYHWSYEWQIIATDQGSFRNVSRRGSDAGGSTTESVAIRQDPGLAGRQHAVVLNQGWWFEFRDGDRHLDDHAFRLHNVRYLPDGTVTWDAGLTYADVNSDDPYTWRYDAVVFAYDGEAPRVRDDGPFDDDGGLGRRSFEEALP